MSLQAGDRVRGSRATSSTEGTVRRGRRLPMMSGENVASPAIALVEWDHVPGAQTAAQRMNAVPVDALERVPPRRAPGR